MTTGAAHRSQARDPKGLSAFAASTTRPTTSLELWREARDLFHQLAGLEVGQQEAALEAAAHRDPELSSIVRRLLEQDRSDHFPADPPTVAPADEEALVEAEWIGSTVGPYRLIRSIGRGGSGVVFLAEREDAEFEHRVAVKVLARAFNPGARRRFQRERQILAHLTHPNIARLMGGGTTPSGLPYVLMELVHGLPITAYCDRWRLTLEPRLDLFRQVCSAVQHAHRNLIVHRDLKPNNILVTADGQVKLLDFGIAKLLDAMQSNPDSGEHGRWMTPSYASPEQVLGQSITTASDIYSLGVLLYELLCGRKPHGADRTELLVPESEAPLMPPSRAWEPAEPEDAEEELAEAAEAANHRGLQPRELITRLRGDLDSIVMKALCRDPDQRFPSVDRLDADLHRHLRGRPVSAHPGGTLYRSRKFIQRHRTSVLVAAILGLLVLALTGTVLWQGTEQAETVRQAQRDQLEAEAALEHALGAAYLKLGRLEMAETSLQIALEHRREVFGDGHPAVRETEELLGRVRGMGRLEGE
jgi:serine/threonine-protein kinase